MKSGIAVFRSAGQDPGLEQDRKHSVSWQPLLRHLKKLSQLRISRDLEQGQSLHSENGKLTGLLLEAPSFAGWDSLGAAS